MRKKIISIAILIFLLITLVLNSGCANSKNANQSNQETVSEQTIIIDDDTNKENDLIGVLHIPSINLTPTPLYRCKSAEEAQLISDNENEAVAMSLYSWRNKDVYRVEFGDHNYQNFALLRWVKEGDVAFIEMGDKTARMVCVSTTLSETLDEYNESIIRDHETITTVTCYGEGTRTVVRWKITEDSDVSFDELFWLVGKYRVAQRDSSFE